MTGSCCLHGIQDCIVLHNFAKPIAKPQYWVAACCRVKCKTSKNLAKQWRFKVFCKVSGQKKRSNKLESLMFCFCAPLECHEQSVDTCVQIFFATFTMNAALMVGKWQHHVWSYPLHPAVNTSLWYDLTKIWSKPTIFSDMCPIPLGHLDRGASKGSVWLSWQTPCTACRLLSIKADDKISNAVTAGL